MSIRSCLRPNWPLHVYHRRIFRWHLFFRWEAREEEEGRRAGAQAEREMAQTCVNF